MIDSVTVSSTWVQGGTNLPLSALGDSIARRARLLGETAEKATISTAINVLKTLRAETSVASAKNAEVFPDNWSVRISDSSLVAGWAFSQGRARRVVREGPGATHMVSVGGCRIINLAGSHQRGEKVRVYSLSILNTESIPLKPFYPAKAESITVLARSREDVERFAAARIRRRIGQYRGTSKRALGLLMHKLHAAAEGDVVPSDVDRLVSRLVSARVYGGGYGSGGYGVVVADELPRAVLALKHGQAGLDMAVEKAANMTAGIINRAVDRRGFGERMPVPFPGIVKPR